MIRYGDYYAEYGCHWNQNTLAWQKDKRLKGYGLRVVSTKQEKYEPIPAVIDGTPVLSLRSTFAGCSNMTIAPVIPDTVEHMKECFLGCTSLVLMPHLPKDIHALYETFKNCVSLQATGYIPDGVTAMQRCFENCSGLSKVRNIPKNLQNGCEAFKNCINLKNIPILYAKSNVCGLFLGSSIDTVFLAEGTQYNTQALLDAGVKKVIRYVV